MDPLIDKNPDVGHSATFIDYQIDSAFQPIFSMANQRIVGFEALVRGRDSDDKPISPAALFGSASNDDIKRELDYVCQQVHVDTFSKEGPANNWLFLNIEPSTLHNKQYRDKLLPEVLKQARFPFHKLVVEVLESEAVDDSDLFDAVDYFRSLGALVALDDFGSGHSNFDRIWRLAPDIVKLDRSVIWEAAKHQTGNLRRVLPNLVSMMHEAGSLVLVEGIENEMQLMIALDAEADFVQGFHLGHPARGFADVDNNQLDLAELQKRLVESEFYQSGSHREKLQKYIQEILAIRGKFRASGAEADTCRDLLAMPDVLRVFLLDENGGELYAILSEQNERRPDKRFSPMVKTASGNWGQREYFRQAIKQPQQVQISRPYLSSTEGRMCLMLSVSNQSEPRRVFCCKLLLEQKYAVAL